MAPIILEGGNPLSDGVTSLRPDNELDEFFSFMWGKQEGYVYAPTKLPSVTKEGEVWETHFFKWPMQRKDLITHVLDNTATTECYFGPALYKSPTEPLKENILGTNVLWTEFDGNSPANGILGDKIPHPTMRVRSSNEGHEHFYWHLDYFETDIERIESINKAIAYRLQADTSAWDATQILRPPATRNHKRDKVVRVISLSQNQYGEEFFSGLKPPKQLVKDELTLAEIPEALSVIFKYKWATEDAQFFRKPTMETGTRSSALMRLAYVCAEMRMSDEEAFSILKNADDRWAKFKHRKDQPKRLLDILNRARLKYPVNPEVAIEELLAYSWTELKALEVHVDWLLPGILQRQGIMVIWGKPGVGKSTYTIQLLMHLALGVSFLNMKIDRPRKVIFVSMEMGAAEIKVFQDQMDSILTEEQRALLHQNFKIVPIGHSLLFDLSADKKKIEKLIEKEKPETVAFDSLSKATMASLDEVNSKAIMDFADHLRMNYDCSILFIHHNRKAQVGNKKPKTIDDMYGSYWIGATATTVVCLWFNERTQEIEVIFLKVRLAKEPKTISITRTVKGLSFEEVTSDSIMGQEDDDTGTEDSEQESTLADFQPKF